MTARIVCIHVIDSHNRFNVIDLRSFLRLPNGDDLETGTMSPGVPGYIDCRLWDIFRHLRVLRNPRAVRLEFWDVTMSLKKSPGCG